MNGFKIGVGSVRLEWIRVDWGSPCVSGGKEPACNVGDHSSIPGLGGSPKEGNGYPLQYSCLENSTDRGTWQIKVHRVTKSQTWLNDSHIKLFTDSVSPSLTSLFRCNSHLIQSFKMYNWVGGAVHMRHQHEVRSYCDLSILFFIFYFF